MFRSFSSRNFRLFFVGQSISQTGNWLTMIAQTLLVLGRTDDNGVAVGVLTACQFLPVLLLGAWAGLVADRSDKRRLLLLVQSAAMAKSLVLALAVFAGGPPLWVVYAIALVGGLTTAFDTPCRRAFIAEMVPPEAVANAASLNSALMTGSRVVGPALAGVSVATIGFGWTFLLDGLSYVAVLGGLLAMRTADLRPAERAALERGGVRAGLRHARAVPELWIPLVMLTIMGIFAFNFAVVVPLLAKTTFGGSDQLFTVMFSMLSVGSFMGALWAARRTTATVTGVVRGSVAFGAGMAAVAVSPSLWVAFPAVVVAGFASMQIMTSATALIQTRAAADFRGRVLALQAMVFLGSTPIGGPIVGAVCDVFGARAGFAVGAAACLTAALWGRSRARRAVVAV